MADDPPQHLLGALRAADGLPQFRTIVQVKGGDGAGVLGGLHPFEDQLGRGRGQRGEDATRVEPPDPRGEDRRPVEVARLEQRAGLIGPVVEHHRRPNSVTAVAVDRGDVRAAHAVVLEPLVERCDARFAHPRLHQLADTVVDHGRGDARAQPEAVREPRGDVVLPA